LGRAAIADPGAPSGRVGSNGLLIEHQSDWLSRRGRPCGRRRCRTLPQFAGARRAPGPRPGV